MAETLRAVASLLWPILAAVVLIMLRPTLVAVLETARSRRFTLKIGGQELTMEEASAQQRALFADLQAQVVELQKQVASVVPSPPPAAFAAAQPPTEPRRILWVDDNPKNNSFFVERLGALGAKVDLAIATADGLRLAEAHHYALVISDMGREEGGTFRPKAGLELLKALRDHGNTVPLVFFCSSRAARENHDEAMGQGATAITSSPTELVGVLDQLRFAIAA